MGSGTGIGRVRGLGSAKHGASHWLHQRMSAIGNLILVPWLGISLFMLPVGDHGIIMKWLAQPIVAVPMILLILSVCYHATLGLRVLIEDYVHDEALKFGALTLLTFFQIGSAAFGIFSVAKLAFATVAIATGAAPNV
jgi:succinate dehydrogenase / fumarate reductase, membrane anchor subunit